MAQTYTVEDIATDETYQVRFLVGDTNLDAMVLQDEEIDWLLTQEANVYMAAAAAADKIILVMAGASGAVGTTGPVTRKRIGQTDISYANGRTSSQYETLAASLRRRGRSHQTIFAGGISQSDKDDRDLDTDRPTSGRIRAGQFDSIDAIPES